MGGENTKGEEHMNISIEGAYIEEATGTVQDGDYISFEDEDGLTIFITAEVIAKLYKTAFPEEDY